MTVTFTGSILAFLANLPSELGGTGGKRPFLFKNKSFYFLNLMKKRAFPPVPPTEIRQLNDKNIFYYFY